MCERIHEMGPVWSSNIAGSSVETGKIVAENQNREQRNGYWDAAGQHQTADLCHSDSSCSWCGERAFIHTLSPAVIHFAEQAATLMTGLFLRLIKMVIAPLVFATLVSGIGKLGDDSQVFRIGGKILLWFISMSFVSLLIGLLAGNILQPGKGFEPPAVEDLAGLKHPFQPVDFMLHIVPTSVLDAMSRNDILQIVVFSVLFGLALPAAGKAGKTMLGWTEELGHIMLRMTDIVMLLAPMAVFGSVMGSIAHSGGGMLISTAAFWWSFTAPFWCCGLC